MMVDELEALRNVNENIRRALLRLNPERKHCSTIQPQDFADLLQGLGHAAEYLGNLQTSSVAASVIEQEALVYRSALENLRSFLPDLHGRLLAEKSRLEAAQCNLSTAVAWARASKETL